MVQRFRVQFIPKIHESWYEYDMHSESLNHCGIEGIQTHTCVKVEPFISGYHWALGFGGCRAIFVPWELSLLTWADHQYGQYAYMVMIHKHNK